MNSSEKQDQLIVPQIKLYQFARVGTSLPNMSPFCMKLELFLRVAKFDYHNIFGYDTKLNPKRQLPFIELDGQIMSDSTLIIDELNKRYGNKIDSHLTVEQQQLTQAIQIMLENRFIKFNTWFRWCYPAGWKQFKPLVFGKIPCPIRCFIARKFAKTVSKALYIDGISRLSIPEMLHLAQKDLQVLAYYLGDKQFMFGNEISLLDIITCAVIANITSCNIDTPLLTLVLKYPSLVEHSKRIMKSYFAELSS